MALIPVDRKPSDEAYTEIASASANQTYPTQLAALQTAFNGMSDTEKMKSVIEINGAIARYSSNGVYSRHAINNAKDGMVLAVYDIPNAEAYQAVIKNGVNPTFVSITGANTAAMKLCTFRQP